ncbi:hypothetical protein PF008_g12572 [Phytophthora fragariae]|uniref:Uncharacterized protein n=3 Tax=Phytophthora TaxID=4783 RepID=A0A6G0RMJ4_9STRA|nr:hypothetical protein PF008_g12572 [Phytophthora fragariae]
MRYDFGSEVSFLQNRPRSGRAASKALRGLHMGTRFRVGALLCLLYWATTTTSSCVHDQLSARLVSSTQNYGDDPRRPPDEQYAPPSTRSNHEQQPIIIEQPVEVQELRWPPHGRARNL